MPQRRPLAPRRSARRRAAGFTLVELLVVMGILAILAGILVPIIITARRSAKRVATHNLLEQINGAIQNFAKDWGNAPPDKIPASTKLVKFRKPSSGTKYFNLSTEATSSEALFYFLVNTGAAGSAWEYNENVSGAPFLELQAEVQHSGHYSTAHSRYVDDYNSNDVPEILDAWGRPFLYNRPGFPDKDYGSGYDLESFDAHGDPIHNVAGSAIPFDLYTVGPDGQTSTSGTLPNPKSDASRLAQFDNGALNTGYGSGPDDIHNW